MFYRSDANYTITMANKQGCRNSQTNLPIVSIVSQIREQMSVPELYVLTVAFLALNKIGFSDIIFFSKNFFEKF